MFSEKCKTPLSFRIIKTRRGHWNMKTAVLCSIFNVELYQTLVFVLIISMFSQNAAKTIVAILRKEIIASQWADWEDRCIWTSVLILNV